MHDTLHKKFVASANKSSVGTFHQNHNKRRKNISYNQHEDYIIDYTEQLMKKHRLGYSSLHKWLILKEAQTQFSTPFVKVMNNGIKVIQRTKRIFERPCFPL